MTYQEFLQRYQYDPVNDRIGKGGFGVVFKAYDTHLDRYVAIKMSEVDDENDSMRLAREVELASKLPTHANIAHYEACYTFATPTGIYDFGILQYYNEGSLNELLAKGSLSMLQKTTILTQILDGIEFLHSHNVVHRDLKPRNILIARRGNEYVPKITDFGLSKEFEAANSTMFGNSITGAGTLAYASPEQLAEKSMRRNTDLWSFGVIAFQMFTGNVPFNTGSHPATSSAGRVELFRQINSGVLPDSLNSITEPWQSLIRKLLVVDPETRLRNCAEARTILVGGASSSSRPADDIDTTRCESASTTSQSANDNTFREAPIFDSTIRAEGPQQVDTTNHDNCLPEDTGTPNLNTFLQRLIFVLKRLGQTLLIFLIYASATSLDNDHSQYYYRGDLEAYFWLSYIFISFVLIVKMRTIAAQQPKNKILKYHNTETIIYSLLVLYVSFGYFAYGYNGILLTTAALLNFIVLYLPLANTGTKRIVVGCIAVLCISALICFYVFDWMWY